ncbi:hypothetical protein FNF29_05296 [Cafeteria roenbergensis]|uniref:Alpha-1,3-glucosyltransferase n=1 Tax=Cafeteria roenbergensis TaxID=33653 RepID=A0A5A8CAY5_CAFRO|nr:hypothetical protein FNF29_05296 [Cafeteria roenbergensis]KAA0151973.1 hypothetical protein FNF31_06732 [Cafeteria roenbergensis]KAA0166955.1 hypothetical protein FNF28_03026 [Cafeteria roenbergensis]|eukprot:KAA0150283.1 hypothetical protein FNF29_05296 [Cafeteria roenbergensis]
MFGDFEAQRHWLELTASLPPHEWYVNGTNNDLQYWGLDYPPLTAWHSLAMAKVAKVVRPSLVELVASRGAEGPADRTFMRLSVIVCDALVLLPALALAGALLPPAVEPTGGSAPGTVGRLVSGASAAVPAAWVFLAFPALLLIDHGHFQYNSASLGLALGALVLLAVSAGPGPSTGPAGQRQSVLPLLGRLGAAALFALALSYKQMTLFLSPAVFVGHLALAWRASSVSGAGSWSRSLGSFAAEVAALGATVCLVTAAVWLPLCVSLPSPAADFPSSCASVQLAALGRVFPFARGLFEDKVASLWCALEPVLRVRRRLLEGSIGLHSVLRLAAAATAALFLPALLSAASLCGCLARRAAARPPSATARATTASAPAAPLGLSLWLCLVACASGLSFFLAAFQVHEKTILVPLAPLAMGAGIAAAAPPAALGPAGSAARRLYQWLCPLAVAGMAPLLHKEGLALPALAASGLAALVMLEPGHFWGWLGASPLVDGAEKCSWGLRMASLAHCGLVAPALSVAHAALLVGAWLLPPVPAYPDLFPQLLSAVHAAALLWALGVVTTAAWQAAADLGAAVGEPRLKAE